VPFYLEDIMGKLRDETGKKFGRLTVVKRILPNQGKQVIYLCKCDCGGETISHIAALKNGHTKSCGCLQKELLIGRRKLGLGISSMRKLIGAYKIGAKRRGFVYDLTEEQFHELTQKDCHYCGAKPSNIYMSKGYNGNYIYNGLDRIDNNKGYTIDNVVPCCYICNQAKHNLTIKDFQEWIRKVYNKLPASI